MEQKVNWRVTYHDNDEKTVEVDVHADSRERSISTASGSAQVRGMYFKSAQELQSA